MGKNEICWAIFSGKTMLPFTIRTTKSQCVYYYVEIGEWLIWQEYEEHGYSCKKVVINDYENVYK